MHQAGLQIARVAKVYGREFFAALIQSEELKIGCRMIQPGHSFRGGAPCACRDDHFEAAKMTASFCRGSLATVVEPENAQRENPIDGGSRFGCAHTDHRFRRCTAQQPPAYVSRAEAVLKVHCRAEPIHLRTDEGAGQGAFEEPLVVAPSGVSRGWGTAIAGGNEFQCLRLGGAHAPRQQTE